MPQAGADADDGPVIPSAPMDGGGLQGSIRRTQTPFQPNTTHDDEDDDEDEGHTIQVGPPPPHRTSTRSSRPSRGSRKRRTQSVIPPRPINQQPLARGTSMSLTTPTRQAPLPPRDVFKDPENRALVDRLERSLEIPAGLTRSLTMSAIPMHSEPVRITQPPPPPPEPQRKKGGLLRAFSKRSSQKQQQPLPPPPVSAPPDIYIYPVPTSAPLSAAPNNTMPILEGEPGVLPVPPLPQSAPPIPGGPTPRGPSQSLYFNENTEHAGFLNHSLHRIFYNNLAYPSAMHLAEAIKFLPHRPDIADSIRTCEDMGEAFSIAAQHQNEQDPAWSSKYLDIVSLFTCYLPCNGP
jgi:hypothetical protein